MEYTLKKIQHQMYLRFSRNNHTHICPSIRLFGWESDMVSVTAKGFLYDYQIRLGVGPHGFDVAEWLIGPVGRREYRPNRFYLVVPEPFVSRVSIPRYAGMYIAYASDRSIDFKKSREAPLLHTGTAPAVLREFILGMCYSRYWNLKLNRREDWVGFHRQPAPRPPAGGASVWTG